MLEHNLGENLDSVDLAEFRELTHKIGNKELEVVLKVVRAIASGEYSEGLMLGVLVGALMVFLALMVATFLYFWRRRRANRVRAQPDAVVGGQDGLVGDGPAINEGVVDGILAMFLALILWTANFYRGPANMLPF